MSLFIETILQIPLGAFVLLLTGTFGFGLWIGNSMRRPDRGAEDRG
jgi:hypothetical protein